MRYADESESAVESFGNVNAFVCKEGVVISVYDDGEYTRCGTTLSLTEAHKLAVMLLAYTAHDLKCNEQGGIVVPSDG